MPSNVIEWMRYEPGQGSLVIAFRGGRGVYRYFDVSSDEWDGFLQSSAKGVYLNHEFKRKSHRFERVEEGSETGMTGYTPGQAALCWPARA